ncbi:RNI-like protein, partial [Eremomyces bilateralis CBS 781.70]
NASGEKSHGGAAAESLHPYVPQAPRTGTGSFFSSALRRLSSSQGNVSNKPSPCSGSVCPRRVLNVDPNRPRCQVPELETKKLRRVAFCVDVEIAGSPRYKDESNGASTPSAKKRKDRMLKDRGEGEALKHPSAVEEQKETEGTVKATGEKVGTEAEPNPEGSVPGKEGDASGLPEKTDKKKEKKKKSEEERKDRKEKRRKKAEECGAVPVEIRRGGSEDTLSSASPPKETVIEAIAPKHRDRPTTDPLRIYRRCCQLRETPILKRITEQLAYAAKCSVDQPGMISVLDLTGSRLQLADVVTLGDWLAVVPVRRLLLEDADLTDEGVRVILAGLLAAKSPELSWQQPHHNQHFEERSGHVEKLTLKNNPRVSKAGWKHIALFLYMCKSLKALDVSLIRFPTSPHTHNDSHARSTSSSESWPSSKPPIAPSDIFAKAIAERLGGDTFEELIMAECGLDTQTIRKITNAVTVSGLKRLGLAGNNVNDEALKHIFEYMKSGVCQGLDLGGNDFRDRCGVLAAAMKGMDESPFWALSLADCNLNPDSLNALLPALVTLPYFKFLDLSHNQDLFGTDPSALAPLRKYLPQFKFLKRIHLADVSLSSAQAIRLAEVLPEAPHLAHLNILENPGLSALANATTEDDQEEACALYASLMAAVRVSESIICIDIDVPSPENSAIVQALGKQVIAYCLRNMDRWTASEGTTDPDWTDGEPCVAGPHREIDIPDVLLHLVGHSDGSMQNMDDEPPAPGGDYVLGGTGVVKALSYVLSEQASEGRPSLPHSGAATPRASSFAIVDDEKQKSKAKNMSKNLLTTARSIQARLRPALLKEATTGDEMAYKRLLFLDNTLQRMIRRFEDEYPECRLKEPVEVPPRTSSLVPPNPAPSDLVKTPAAPEPTPVTESGPVDDANSDDEDPPGRPTLRSRHNSDVSLASRALSIEEGQMHRLGQHIRRDILGDAVAASDGAHAHKHEDAFLVALRAKLQAMPSSKLRDCVLERGWEGTLAAIGENVEELRRLRE